jgi:CRISPR system Cascade subunit CasE
MYQSSVLITGGFRNDYGIHQAVWSLFPGDAKARRDFLYRAEARDRQGRARLLLQSLRQPKNSSVAKVLKQQRFPAPALTAADSYRFVLTANPVKAVKQDRARSNRQPLIENKDRHVWLIRKLKDAAKVTQVVIQELPPIRFRKPREDFRSGCIQPVLFVGELKMENREKLIRLCRQGIGPAKGFGCGLLTLMPIK